MTLGLALGACATGKEQRLDNPEPYFKQGQHYTYAVYNSDNLLISHPHEVWSKASKDALFNKKPYTDLYIVSHGWNFTHQEAIANFQQYMKVWDKKAQDKKEYGPGFNPYIIFVVWKSTSRPITDSVEAVFPFGLDKSLDPITKPADVAIHTITGWKQSINAEHIALGRNFPVDYENKEYSSIEIDEDNDIGGRDIPLSMVLYEIIKTNHKIIKKCKDKLTESTPDTCEQQCNKKLTESKPGTCEPQKIHLVGHSYGAKLISLASLEALRRIYLNESAKLVSNASREALRRIYPDKTNDSSGVEEDPFPPAAIFESLVLLNAAFAPNELNYYYDYSRMGTEVIYSLWTHIPRKALVYSNTDLATGILFNTGQIIFNTHEGQRYDVGYKSFTSLTNKFKTHFIPLGSGIVLSTVDAFFEYIYIPVFELILGAVNVAYNLAFSPVFWAIDTVLNLPEDLYHHVVSNDTFGESPYWKFLNIPHFFLPLDKLWPYWGFGEDNFSDHQGLWRGTFPAIGRTGLHRLRSSNARVFGIFTANDGKENDKNVKESSNINAKHFNDMACSRKNFKPEPRIFDNKKLFYSFDGSEVYDSGFSHGDLRSKEPANICGNENDEDEDIIQKREATFNFITKFTLGRDYPYNK